MASAGKSVSTHFAFVLVAMIMSAMASPAPGQQSVSGSSAAEAPPRILDRLWIWGHPAGVYNDSFLAPLSRKSTIEPVAAADMMGIRNMIFVRYEGQPTPPFDEYYQPFKKLDRVVWSLVGAGGSTSGDERRDVYSLAEQNDNIVGFILDDFFHVRPGMWLAANQPQFPVVLSLTAPGAIRCESLELVQTDWHSGDYRSKAVVVELSADGQKFDPWHETELPDAPGASVRIALPAEPLRAIRIQIRSTHDTAGAISCGLKSVRLVRDGRPVDLRKWQAAATSCYPGFFATDVLEGGERCSASLTPEQLHELGERRVRNRKLPITAVVYVRQISSALKQHLDEVDQVSLWTWRPEDLDRLPDNLAALERLIPGKPILLGCYMYNFDQRSPLAVERMAMQIQLGERWLREGRIAGMIFLATPNVDVGLEAVEWTRRWIAHVGQQPLE